MGYADLLAHMDTCPTLTGGGALDGAVAVAVGRGRMSAVLDGEPHALRRPGPGDCKRSRRAIPLIGASAMRASHLGCLPWTQ